MNYYRPENGHGGPAHGWPTPQPPPPSGKSGIFDLAKGSLSVTVVGTVLYAALTVGMAVGAYQERGANMAQQLAELKTISTRTDERIAKIEAVIARLDQRWAVEVRK